MEDCMSKDDKSQREIRKIAYGIWMQEGQPEGRDREHWEAAKEIWAFRSHNHVLTDENDNPFGGARPMPPDLTDRHERRRPPRGRAM